MRDATGGASAAASAAFDRVLVVVGEELFSRGYGALTMDDVANETGMSKKTLYRLFPNKEQMAGAVLDRFAGELRGELDAILAAGEPFAVTVGAVASAVAPRVALFTPAFLRDLRRFAPSLFAKIEQLRGHHFPAVWEQLLRRGVEEGVVRADLDAPFAAQLLLGALRVFSQPNSPFAQTLSSAQIIARTLDLILNGMLTLNGRQSYAKLRSK